MHCAYGVAVEAQLKSAASVPAPYPLYTSPNAPFVIFNTAITPLPQPEFTPHPPQGDGVVNLQSLQGCDRMADSTKGTVFTSTAADTQHILVVRGGPGASILLDRVLSAAGMRKPRK
jgi:hypothetical protein